VTGRHRGPKRKLRAGYRAPSLQRTSYLHVMVLCEASSILHRRVWYRALSLRMQIFLGASLLKMTQLQPFWISFITYCIRSRFRHGNQQQGYCWPCGRMRSTECLSEYAIRLKTCICNISSSLLRHDCSHYSFSSAAGER